jgi:hypothetical protein
LNFTKSIATSIGIIIFTLLTITVNAQTKSYKKITKKSIYKDNKQNKELVYLFTANGGVVGYFSDGSVVGCPRCDFCRTNILVMFKEKPMGKWDLKKPLGFVSDEGDNGWVLINYKWKEKVPQF